MLSRVPAARLHDRDARQAAGRRFALLRSLGIPFAAAVFALLAFASLAPAEAANMSFSGISGFCVDPNPTYVENSITARGVHDNPAAFFDPGVLRLEDGGTNCPHRVEFTMATPFDAVSVDILPVGSNYCADPATCDHSGDPYENVLWEGLIGGTVVASHQFFMGTADSTYAFGSAFSGLDVLRVTALAADAARLGGVCTDAHCAQFEIDNLNLSAIPLPGAAWLLASAIGALAVMAGPLRRSRRGAAT